jgi:hypothetical protein
LWSFCLRFYYLNNFDSGVRADNPAQSAGITAPFIAEFHNVITGFVDFGGQSYFLNPAGIDADHAPLAPVFVYDNAAFFHVISV